MDVRMTERMDAWMRGQMDAEMECHPTYLPHEALLDYMRQFVL